MSIEISHEPKTGSWSISYKRHLFVAVGMAFLVAGLGALTGPWWQPFAVAALGLADVKVDAAPSYLVGGLMVVIGLSILIYKHRHLDTRSAELTSDKATISKDPPDTEAIDRYLSHLVDDHSFQSSFDSKFRDAYTRFLKPENAFRNGQTVELYTAFSDRAAELHLFVAANFFIFPDNQGPDSDYRYCLEPDLNMDRNMVFDDHQKVARYGVLQTELQTLTAETRTAYAALIRHLKMLGHI